MHHSEIFYCFLNLFLDDKALENNVIIKYKLKGYRYRYLKIRTTKSHHLYSSQNLSSWYSERHIDVLFTTKIADKHFPYPIGHKVGVCSVYWANSLLKSQQPW